MAKKEASTWIRQRQREIFAARTGAVIQEGDVLDDGDFRQALLDYLDLHQS